MATAIQYFPGVTGSSYSLMLFASDARVYRNSNGTLNAVSALTSTQWGLSLLSMTEKVTSNSVATGHYIFDLSGLHANFASLPGQYTAVVAAGTTWLGVVPDAIAQFYWDGTSIVTLSGDGFSRIGSTGSGLTSLASQASLDTVAGYVDTEVATILTNLSTLTTNVSTLTGYVDTEVATLLTNLSTLTTNVATLSGYVDTEVLAIKAKTDLITGAPAVAGDAMTLTAAYNSYFARIQFCRDQTNTKDEYTVMWYYNSVLQTSGVTVPTIQVIKRADGTNLIASTAMTQIASTGLFKYDATGSARLTKGESNPVVVTATINGSTRTWADVVGRDSP